jgi:predicted nucleic acid-binding protein
LIAYFDSGVLIQSYIPEANSAAADALIAQTLEPIPFTHFHAIEIRTALRLNLGRREITDAQLKNALRLLQEDIDTGRLNRPTYDVSIVFHEAEDLSAKYAAATLARSLDILHVAAAIVIGARQFITFDKRQAALASKAGLKLKKQRPERRAISL